MIHYFTQSGTMWKTNTAKVDVVIHKYTFTVYFLCWYYIWELNQQWYHTTIWQKNIVKPKAYCCWCLLVAPWNVANSSDHLSHVMALLWLAHWKSEAVKNLVLCSRNTYFLHHYHFIHLRVVTSVPFRVLTCSFKYSYRYRVSESLTMFSTVCRYLAHWLCPLYSARSAAVKPSSSLIPKSTPLTTRIWQHWRMTTELSYE